MAEEIWKPVAGYEGLYEVSNQGRVKSLRQNRIMTRNLSFAGSLRVNLVGLDKKLRTVYIARLVLTAFVGCSPADKPLACHKDDNALDNRVENLYWGSKVNNANDAIRNGRSLSGTPQGGGVNRNKTHCVHGHEFTPENTGIRNRPSGGRYCKRCAVIRREKRHAYFKEQYA